MLFYFKDNLKNEKKMISEYYILFQKKFKIEYTNENKKDNEIKYFDSEIEYEGKFKKDYKDGYGINFNED